MKLFKILFSIIILSILTTTLLFTVWVALTGIFDTEKVVQTKINTQSETTVKPDRIPNISDKNYAQALMSHKREQITDINVLRDYDGVLRTVKTNIDNGVANQEDYRLLEIYNGVYGGQENDVSSEDDKSDESSSDIESTDDIKKLLEL